MKINEIRYPFTAVVGQDRAKLALILNAINPDIGGVLITGAKGTGKSILVESLLNIIPKVKSVNDCPFHCNPEDAAYLCDLCRSRLKLRDKVEIVEREINIVRVPLSATEDRILGSLDVEKALVRGIRALQPGLLAEANNNILYIDEVNLLRDHLVDAILDPASSGWNIVEREGVSVRHPSRFILVGTMNPEEGELRPQLLDRFPLHAETETIKDPLMIKEIVKRNDEFERDPLGFIDKFWKSEMELKEKILRAREILTQIEVSEEIYKSAAKVCSEMKIDGHRADIVIIKAAMALAAFQGRREVKPEDVLVVADLALSHRTRESGLASPLTRELIKRRFRKAFAEFKVTIKKVKTDLFKSRFLSSKIVSEVPGITVSSQDFKEIRKARRKPLNFPFYVVMPLLFASMLYIMSVLTLLIYHYLIGFSGGVMESISTGSILQLMSLYTALFFILYIINKRRRKPSVIFLYHPEKNEYVRRVVESMSIGEEKHIGGFEQYIPLKSRYFPRLGVLINYGKKIIEFLASSSEEEERDFNIALRGSLSRRRGLIGRHVKTLTSTRHGHYVWHELPKGPPLDIAIVPTLRVAALNRSRRKKPKNLLLTVEPQDFRVKVRESRSPITIIVLLDVSESMTTSLDSVRNVLKGLKAHSFRRRDRVGLIVFKGSEALLLQYPITNVNLILSKLTQVGASDYTPLAAGMLRALNVLRVEMRRDRDAIPLLIIITDGIANVPLKRPLSVETRKMLINNAQADALDVARIIAREGIYSIIINTNHRDEELERRSTIRGWYQPTEFMVELARIMGSKYYGIGGHEKKVREIVITEALVTTPASTLRRH